MSRRRILRLLVGFLAFGLPFLVGLRVHQQGFNLLDDGLWLLGADLVSEGGVLYRDLFTIYGPARFFLLVPFLVVLGKSAWSLAVFKACLDGAAGLFGYGLMRRMGAGWWSALVPVGVIALGPVLPRYLGAAVFAAFAGGVLVRGAGFRSGFFLGTAWGLLGLFGLDMAGYGGVILLVGLSFAAKAAGIGWVRSARPWLGVLVGLGAVLGSAALITSIRGITGAAAWDTVVYPLTRFREAMGVSWLDSFRGSPWLTEVFAGHYTGEVLPPAWSGQSVLRSFGLRAMFLLAWILPVAGLFAARRRGDLRLSLLAALGVAGWATLTARGDVEHLRLIWFCVLVPLPVIVSGLPRRVSPFPAAAVLLALAPLGAEQVWLAAHLDRPGLEEWGRPRAGIRLDAHLRDQLESLCRNLDAGPVGPVLVWPAQPGLQFVLAAPPATSQATLLPGEMADPKAVLAELEISRPRAAVIGPTWGRSGAVRSMQEATPTLWSYLRSNFLLEEEFVHGGDTFKTASRAVGGRAEVAAAPLSRRLPGTAHYLRTHNTEALGPDLVVAQTFAVKDFDLAGVALMLAAPGPFPYRASFTIKFIALDGPAAGNVLAELPVAVSLDRPVQKQSFSFGPLAGTAGRMLAMEISGNPDGREPFALRWHKPAEGVGPAEDFYPAGRIVFNGRPAAGDLYFITY